MALFLEKAIFVNRAPFDHLELDFKEKGINVLSAINGKGKTTILSHITDAFYEMARECFSNSFEGRENTYYRFSASLFHLVMGRYSIVYLRFKYNNEVVDYTDCRGKDLNKKQYEGEVKLQNIIPYNDISSALGRNNCAKIFSKNLNKKKIEDIFEKNVLTFFPAYRYETPFYLTDPYKISLSFNTDLNFSGYLKNPIEVRTEVQMLASWIMDIVLDGEIYKQRRAININGQQHTIDVTPERTMFENLRKVLSAALSSKYKEGNLRFGIGKRNLSGGRIAVMQDIHEGNSKQIAPNIFCLSSGELSLLCLFGEIMRQADKLRNNIAIKDIEGIVLIDEVDLHLHIKLQKEVLPRLFKLFPNVQFILSSHSPFLNMGLADDAMERAQIIDLDEKGIVCAPTNNEMYQEVYNMMVEENSRFAIKYNELLEKIGIGSKPLIITEGKTDYKHIRNAMKVLERTDVDVEFYKVPPKGWGSGELKKMLDTISLIRQSRIIIGIFDRDEDAFLRYLDVEHQPYKKYGNNVYAFALPLVNETMYGSHISIEHYYNRDVLLKEDTRTHRRLFLGDEFYPSGNSKDGNFQTRTSNIQTKVAINGVIDDKVYERGDLEQKTSLALTKDAFVTLIETDEEYACGFDFQNFKTLIDVIKEISELPLE